MEIVNQISVSIDGKIAPPDGRLDWLKPFSSAANTERQKKLLATVDCLLMGSRTYQEFLENGEWPFSGTACRVFSRRPQLVTMPNVAITAKSPGEVICELSARHFQRVLIAGGGKLAAAFRADGLIDAYQISVIPVILGDGIPLFGSDGFPGSLRLMNCDIFPGGVVQLDYSVSKTTVDREQLLAENMEDKS